MATTKIQWTDKTWNPIIGCSKISPGCKNCYAEKMAKRLVYMGKARSNGENKSHELWVDYSSVTTCDASGHPTGWNGETVLRKSVLTEPLKWKKPSMVFVCSMGDLFHESVPFEWIDAVFSVMSDCDQHTYQVLTKRPYRMKEFFEYKERQLGMRWYPKDNIWSGVSIEDQETANERLPLFWSKYRKPLEFISVEPLISEVDIGNIIITDKMIMELYDPDDDYSDTKFLSIDNLFDIDWVIVGCETGPKRRPCKLEWIEDIVAQCLKANVPVFVKQIELDGKVVKDFEKFPESVRCREFPNIIMNG